MENKGVVSVLIPVYNRQEYIAECINSVLEQSYQNFEIVIVDDGSTDNTLQICEEMARTEPRIRIYHGEHIGISAVRNKTLEAASGEYVFFLDSDDVIHPRLLEVLVTGLEKTGAKMGGTRRVSVAYTAWEKVRSAMEKETELPEPEYHDHEDTVRCLFAGGAPLGIMGGIIMRRDLVDQTRYLTDLFIGEDYYFIYENLIKGADTIFVLKRWYYGRIHKQNISNNYTFEGFRTRFLRRRLVWESEQRLGRPENVVRQKVEATDIFFRFLKKNKMSKAEKKQMLQLVKQYKKDLLSDLSAKAGLKLRVALYMPKLFRVIDDLLHGKEKKSAIWD